MAVGPLVAGAFFFAAASASALVRPRWTSDITSTWMATGVATTGPAVDALRAAAFFLFSSAHEREHKECSTPAGCACDDADAVLLIGFRGDGVLFVL